MKCFLEFNMQRYGIFRLKSFKKNVVKIKSVTDSLIFNSKKPFADMSLNSLGNCVSSSIMIA